MDYFAIVERNGAAVYRLQIERTTQEQMDRVFERQALALLDDSLEVVPFTGENFSPDESEVWEIAPFDLPPYAFDPLQNIAGCPTLPNDEEVISGIYCIFAYDPAQERLIFQVIQKQQKLSTSALAVLLSNNTFTKLRDPGLVLATACHAVHTEGRLRFKNLWWVKQIFDISEFYRLATEADVHRFAEIEAIQVDDVEALKKQTGQWARKRIAFIVDSGVLTRYAPRELATRAAELGVQLELLNDGHVDKIKIPNDRSQLRSVLKFLEEELYIGPITGVAYEANSKRKRA